MAPDYSVIADRRDITAAIRARLLELRITDEAGEASDTLEIRLDDRDREIRLPRKGAELEVSLGYKGEGLRKMGRFVVDEIALGGPPDSLTIRAKAADMRKGLKAPKTRSFDDVLLSDLVARIAKDHQLIPRVGEDLAGIHFPHMDQADESDLHFLTRIARQYGAVAKPINGRLLLVPRGEAKAASGAPLPTITIRREEVSRFGVTLADRGRYQTVIAYWHDTQAASRVEVSAGSGEPTYRIPRPFSTSAEARVAAEAKLASLARGTGQISLAMPGRPELYAGSPLSLSGFREGIDGGWVAQRVTHRLSSSGLATEATGESRKAK